MQFNEIVAPTMKELFAKEIIKLILTGQLSPGDKLLTEREMASQMKVSRTIINLGMTELASMGFIEIVPRKGAYVADYIKQGNLDTLVSIVNFNGGKFDKKTLGSIMQFRKINEREGTYLCAINRSEEDVADLKYIYAQMLKTSDPSEIGKLIFKFHHTILCASGNNIFPLVYNAFEAIIIKLATSVFTATDGKFILEYLGKMVIAIEKKQAEEAKNLIEELLSKGIDSVDEHYMKWFS